MCLLFIGAARVVCCHESKNSFNSKEIILFLISGFSAFTQNSFIQILWSSNKSPNSCCIDSPHRSIKEQTVRERVNRQSQTSKFTGILKAN